jgi:hypothetical protein
MTDRALWDRAFVLIHWATPEQNQGPQDLDLVLEQLKFVLKELELRGQQLALFGENPRIRAVKQAAGRQDADS